MARPPPWPRPRAPSPALSPACPSLPARRAPPSPLPSPPLPLPCAEPRPLGDRAPSAAAGSLLAARRVPAAASGRKSCGRAGGRPRGCARPTSGGRSGPGGEGARRSMPPPPSAAAMDFSQNSLFGYSEDLQELTIIERPVRRSLKVRAPGRRSRPLGARRPAASRPRPVPAAAPLGPLSRLGSPCHPTPALPGPLLRRSWAASPSLTLSFEGRAPGSLLGPGPGQPRGSRTPSAPGAPPQPAPRTAGRAPVFRVRRRLPRRPPRLLRVLSRAPPRASVLSGFWPRASPSADTSAILTPHPSRDTPGLTPSSKPCRPPFTSNQRPWGAVLLPIFLAPSTLGLHPESPQVLGFPSPQPARPSSDPRPLPS